MWKLLLLAIAISTAAMAQDVDSTNMNCVKRLEMPAYPALAKSVVITGTVTASIALDADAKTQKVETSFASRSLAMFDASLNAALKKSDFQKTCAGKIVRLVFHFEITGQLADNLKETVAYGYPNEFWIISERQEAQIN
jgi:outer membrane biosynthesis protein TonB